jgi:hypothetical protein
LNELKLEEQPEKFSISQSKINIILRNNKRNLSNFLEEIKVENEKAKTI